MKTITIKEAKSNLNGIFEEVNKSSNPLLVTNDKGKNCYLIGEDDFNAILETLFLNSIEGLKQSIIKEGKTSYKEATNFEYLDW